MGILISFYTIYSTNTTKTQVMVTGWRTATNDVNYQVKYNKDYVSVTIHTENVINVTNAINYFGAEVLKDGNIDLRPKNNVSITADNNVTLIAKDNNYTIGYWRITGNTVSGRLYGHLLYARKSV